MNDVIKIWAFYDPLCHDTMPEALSTCVTNNQPSSLNDVIYECSQKIQLLELNFFSEKCKSLTLWLGRKKGWGHLLLQLSLLNVMQLD